MVYISDIQIVHGTPPPDGIECLWGTSGNLNDGRGGTSAYLSVKTSNVKSEAIYGVDVVISDFKDPNPHLKSYGEKPDQKDFLYLKPYKKPRPGHDRPITRVALFRHQQRSPLGDFGDTWLNLWENFDHVGTHIKAVFNTLWDHSANLWMWYSAMKSADLNSGRGGDVLAVLLQYEGQGTGRPMPQQDWDDSDEEQANETRRRLGMPDPPSDKPDKAINIKASRNPNGSSRPIFIDRKELVPNPDGDLKDLEDYRDRLYWAHCYSEVAGWFKQVRENAVSQETKDKWVMLNERYQYMRGIKRKKDSNPWDMEKHVRDAIAAGW